MQYILHIIFDLSYPSERSERVTWDRLISATERSTL